MPPLHAVSAATKGVEAGRHDDGDARRVVCEGEEEEGNDRDVSEARAALTTAWRERGHGGDDDDNDDDDADADDERTTLPAIPLPVAPPVPL